MPRPRIPLLFVAVLWLAGCHSPAAPAPAFVLPDGQYPYLLSLSPVETCVLGSSFDPKTGITTQSHPSELAFNGTLQVSGHSWDFALPQVQRLSGQSNVGGLDLHVDTSVELLSGTIGGGFSLDRLGKFGVGVWSSSARTNPQTDFRGSVNASGTMTGSFEGYVQLEDNETGDQTGCMAPLFTVKFSPR